ncbi:MAG TPA: copper amine oxidase N-terminal domain-containing protein [Candidatus Dormibacteraeota bacterium]|nr:copper amine oxidase N-terminal domain-containing protein [Candidatus Dormibacteraeota bacterium]
MALRLPPQRYVWITLVVSSFLSALLALARPVEMTVDGRNVPLDVPPVTAWHETFVPARALFEQLGARMSFDAHKQSFTAVSRDDTIVFCAGLPIARIDGKRVGLTHAPFIERGRMMIPVSFVERELGARVSFDSQHYRLDFAVPGMVEAGAQRLDR